MESLCIQSNIKVLDDCCFTEDHYDHASLIFFKKFDKTKDKKDTTCKSTKS